MADRPVFLYAAVYDEIADAEADYEAVFDLHAAGAIGTFDSAVIRKEEDGKVRVTKTEKPTQHGAWTGAGVGALVGIIFPPAILGSAIVGAGAGALTGHLSKGISRGDLKELGDELEAGTAAVIVLGESKIEEQLEKALARANKVIEKQVDADADELEREIDAAAKAGAANGESTAGAVGKIPRRLGENGRPRGGPLRLVLFGFELGFERHDRDAERRGDVGGGADCPRRADDRRDSDEDALDLLDGDPRVRRRAEVHEVGARRGIHGRQGRDARRPQRVRVEVAARHRLSGHRRQRVEDGGL